MAATEDILRVVRYLTRDFGTPFEINFAPGVGGQLRLVHPMVDPSSVVVLNNVDGTLLGDDSFAVNSHQGVLRLARPGDYPEGVTVQGVYFQWFLDEDLLFYIDVLVKEHLHHRTGYSLDDIHGAEVEVVGIGAMVLSLEAILFELSTDLDVVSPEGVNIPAHQRHNQVSQLVNYWKNQYDEKAAMLNVGLKKIEVFDLRRTSRATERLVPVYRPRELDQYGPPVRVRPPIGPIEETPFDTDQGYWGGSDGLALDDGFFGQGGV